LTSDPAFDLDQIPGREPERQLAAGAVSEGLGWPAACEEEGKKRLRQARESNQRFMGFASPAVAVRRSIRLPEGSLNAP